MRLARLRLIGIPQRHDKSRQTLPPIARKWYLEERSHPMTGASLQRFANLLNQTSESNDLSRLSLLGPHDFRGHADLVDIHCDPLPMPIPKGMDKFQIFMQAGQ